MDMTKSLVNAVQNSPYVKVSVTRTGNVVGEAHGVTAIFDSLEEFIHTQTQKEGEYHETQT